jgi:type II secretory pathway component GspD/PulD (secretin)
MTRSTLPLLFAISLFGTAGLSAQTPDRAAGPRGCPPDGPRCITLSVRDMEIRDLVAGFARFSGSSMVLGAGVSDRASAEIRDQPWDIALQSILNAHGYQAVATPTGILRVEPRTAPQDREAGAPLVTRVFRLSYVPAGELAASLGVLRSDRGSITAHAATNSLIVTDTEPNVRRIAALLGH